MKRGQLQIPTERYVFISVTSCCSAASSLAVRTGPHISLFRFQSLQFAHMPHYASFYLLLVFFTPSSVSFSPPLLHHSVTFSYFSIVYLFHLSGSPFAHLVLCLSLLLFLFLFVSLFLFASLFLSLSPSLTLRFHLPLSLSFSFARFLSLSAFFLLTCSACSRFSSSFLVSFVHSLGLAVTGQFVHISHIVAHPGAPVDVTSVKGLSLTLLPHPLRKPLRSLSILFSIYI